MAELPGTMAALQRAIQRGEWSAAEALQAQRRRLREADARWHAVVDECPEAGDAHASQGPLLGIGLSHKDIFDLPHRRAGLGVGHGVPDGASTRAGVLDKLASQGASQIATLTMAAHACGATGANDAFVRCVNPLRAEAVVGGSSSGSAVAVAGGLSYASLGTDTAGSVRIPAATCGVLGLKTTHGLIVTQGMHPLAPSLDSIGILARSADDVAMILDAVAPAAGAPTAPEAAPRMKVFCPLTMVADEVASAIAGLADAFEATPCDPSIDDEHRDLSELAEIVLRAEAAATHRASLLDGSAPDAVKAIALAGLAMPPAWSLGALADRGRRMRAFVKRHLTDHDILIAPALTAPVPDWDEVTPGHPRFDGKALLALHRTMGFINYLGLPSLAVPIGSDRRGMPISVQLVGRPCSERRLLGVARSLVSRGFEFDGSRIASFED